MRNVFGMLAIYCILVSPRHESSLIINNLISPSIYFDNTLADIQTILVILSLSFIAFVPLTYFTQSLEQTAVHGKRR